VTKDNAHLWKAGIVITSGLVFTMLLQSQDMDNWRRATMDIGLPDALNNFILIMLFMVGFGAWFWISFKMVDSQAEKHRLDQLEALLEDAKNDEINRLSQN
jgi:hypothetical protein